MINRIKTVLVDSFVAAIALGWIFAQAATHFAFIFSAPIAGWAQRRQIRAATSITFADSFSLRDSVPELAKFVAMLVVGLLLLRWLYIAPVTSSPMPAEESEVES